MRAFFQARPEKEILSTPLKEFQTSISIDDIGSSLLASVSILSAMFPLPWSCLSAVAHGPQWGKLGRTTRRKRYGPAGLFAN